MSAIKALGEERFGGYGVLFGAPDQKDVQREYFTATTDYALTWYDKRPALYHHGQDKRVESQPIGTIDTIKADDIGLWIEGQWNKANEYLDAVKQLVKAGKLGWSSGTLNYLKKVDPDGRITRWPIAEISMTPTPAEPRATGVSMKHITDEETVTAAFKSIGITPDIKALQEADASTAQDSGGEGDDVQPDTKAQEGNIMDITQEALAAMLKDAAKAGATEALANVQPPQPEAKPPVTFTTPDVLKSGIIIPQPGERRPENRKRSNQWSDMQPEDMEFAALLCQQHGYKLNETFFRELEDKTNKAVDMGRLPESAAYKSGELNYSTSAGYGDEIVPNAWSSNLIPKARQDNVVLPLFTVVDMPTNPWELPYEGADPTAYKVAETTDQNKLTASSNNFTQSKAGTGKVTLTATKIGIQVAWSRELDEDSIPAFAPLLQRKTTRAMLNTFDYAILNGDTTLTATTNINYIDGTPGGAERYTVFNGLRKYGIITNTAQQVNAAGAAPSVDLLRQLQGKLGGAYMHDIANLALIVDNRTYLKMKSMPEYSTVDKAGGMATNVTGMFGAFDGIPVYPSAELALSRTDGKIHSTTGNSFGTAILVNRTAFTVGFRRRVSMLVETIGASDSNVLTMTTRMAFDTSYDTTAAAVLYYLGV